MKRLLLLAPLALAACASPGAQPFSPVRDFHYGAISHDPFWLVSIGDDRIVLTMGPAGGRADGELTSFDYPRVLPRMANGVKRWESGGGTQVITVEARPGPCSTGGRTYADSTRIFLSGRHDERLRWARSRGDARLMPISDARARELGAQLAELARNAYAPYSHFHVAALALTDDGRVFEGVNLENASYGLSLCAETSALAAAATGGGFAGIAAIAVIGGRMENGVLAGDLPVFPCGRCRQLINETASLQGRDVELLCFSGDAQSFERTSIRALLPHAFGPGDLA